MKIGKNIQYFRSQKGVSQQWLADAIGVSKMSISYFENDKRRPDITKRRPGKPTVSTVG